MTLLIRRESPPAATPYPVTELPFVKDLKVAQRRKERSFWAVERTADYGAACAKGREYAAHYLQYLKQNPDGIGLLGRIAGAMVDADGFGVLGRQYSADDGADGYAVGFFSFIDNVLRMAMGSADPFVLAQREIDFYAECARRRAGKAAEGEAA